MNNTICKLVDFQLPNIIKILLFFCFSFLPHLTLDYVFHTKLGDQLRFENGQYYFYLCSFSIALFLFAKLRCDGIKFEVSYFGIYLSLAAMTLGVVLSSGSIYELRLFLIVMSLAVFCWVVAEWIIRYWGRDGCVVAVLIVIPFSIGPIFSVIIESLHLLFDDFYIQVPKHSWHNPPRWHFLDANANGFGFDAALSVLVFCGVALFKWPSKTSVISFVLATVCAFALYKSGTRAAFLFLFVSSISMGLLSFGAKKTLGMVLILAIVSFILLKIFGIDSIQHLIRFRGGVESFSSGRLDGLRELWNMFLASPFIGQGFGFVDSGRTSAPSNLFYFGLLSEIGIVGFLGAMGFLSYPLCLYLRSLGKNSVKGSDKQLFFLIVFSVSVLIGLFVYLLFEFSVLRVSVYHQLFFLCWSFTLLSLRRDRV